MLNKLIRRQAYYIASVAFIVLGLVYFFACINQPYIGLELENVTGQWIVRASDSNGEGYRSGIRVGDQILKIDNQDPGAHRFVQKWNDVEDASLIEVRSSGQLTNNIITITKRPAFLMALSELPMVILAFVFWLLGFVTWYKRSFLVQARALFWLNWFIALAIVVAPASSRDLMVAGELELISLSAVPIFLINFITVFPRESKNQLNRYVRLILGFMVLSILFLTILQSTGVVQLNSLLRKLVLSNMILGIVFAFWNLGVSIKTPKDKSARNQISIVLMGMVVGFTPIILLTAVPVILNFRPIVDAQVSGLFVAVIPATWYYVIINKYLPDSRRLLERIISFCFTGVVISFIVSYAFFSLEIVKTFNLEVYLSSLSLCMLFIVCASFIHNVICKLLERLAFFEGNKGLKRRVLKLNESLTSINGEEKIIEEVVETLLIEGAFIVVDDGQGGYLKRAVGNFLEKTVQQAELEQFFHVDEKINLNAKILPDSFPAEIYIPFVTNEYTCGIFLGPRHSHVIIKQSELPLITLICSQLAHRLMMTLIIQNLSNEIKFLAKRTLDSQRKSQGLQGITSSLFRNIEQERKTIARGIQDGPLQLGLDLNRWLKFLKDECPTDNDEKTKKTIAHMRELVEDLNFELRLIASDLCPPTLNDLGLLSTIELMCEEIMLKELLLISLETDGINQDDRFNEDVELVAYRFLQEGILNAVKHSGSNKLKIHIEKNHSSIELTVRDGGKGFDISKMDDWSLTGVHLGLVGMKERVEGLGGELQYSSIIHRGTTLKAIIPIN